MAFSQPSERSSRAGFTLVEVTLALGIVAFAFLALLALLPAGNVAFRRAMDLSICGQIAQRVIADCQNADFDTLTEARNATSFVPGHTLALTMRYFDEQGREIVPTTPQRPNRQEIARAVYWVHTRVMQTAALPRNATRTIRVAETRLGEVRPLNPMAQITVQVVHNPNLIDLAPWINASDPDDANIPDRNLVADRRNSGIHLDIFTYSAMIGRNQ